MNPRTIDLKLYRYHIQTWGNATSSPLIFLHGFMGSSQDFAPVIDRLSQDYYCVAVDLPGHGKTQVLGDESCYRMEAIAPSLIQVVDRLALSPCHLLGYSMGGRIALYLAIHYPKHCQSVILESTSPGLATDTERRDRSRRDQAIAQRLEQENFEVFLDWWYGLPLFKTLRGHPTYGDMLKRRRQNNPQELARSLRHLSTGQQPPLWTVLPRLIPPCLWIVGQADSKFVQIGQQVQALNPKIEVKVITSYGHSIHQEAPALFSAFVQSFLGIKNPRL